MRKEENLYIAKYAAQQIWKGNYTAIGSLLAHLGGEGCIEAAVYTAVVTAIEVADDTMIRNAINSFDKHYFEDSNGER